MKAKSYYTKLMNAKAVYKVYCSCGHPTFIYPFEKKQKKICTWCGLYVYSNKKEEFIDNLRKEGIKYE